MKPIEILRKIILINKDSRRFFYKKTENYFFNIFSVLFFLREILAIVGISGNNFTKPIITLTVIVLLVLISAIIFAYFDFKQYCKKKYKIDREIFIEICVGNYIENARQLIEEDKKINPENKAFFCFGTNNGFRFDVVVEGSLQYDFTTEFFKGDVYPYEKYQSIVDGFLENSEIQYIGIQSEQYNLYNFGTICEMKFPINALKTGDKFSLLLFADSKRTDNGNIIGDQNISGNIKNIWKYMKQNGYINKRILIPVLGTGCAQVFTHKQSIKAIVDAFFEDINNNYKPAFKEMIISIPPNKVGDNIDLLEIERYIELKKLSYKMK